MKITNNQGYFLRIILISILAVIGIIGLQRFFNAPIKIGILHSLTGSLALSEKPMVDAELMAVDQVNASGGLLGRKIVALVVDGKSDEKIFEQEARRLIQEENVAMIIGGWTSASRKAMKPVVEAHNNLLIYPVTYEGLEESPNILYTGATQNQQIVPCALWSFYNLGKRFFLVGSDEIYSHLMHEIVQGTLSSIDAKIVGKEYVPLNSTAMEAVIKKIVESKPEVIINTIQGESNLAFFKALRAHGIIPEKIPVMSVGSVSETEFAQIGTSAMAGDYVTASYFQTIDRDQNERFIWQFKKKYGEDRVISEAMQTGYTSILLWAQAVQMAGSVRMQELKKHLYNRVLNAPEGIIYTDNSILNTWKMIYIGKLRSDGQFSIVWDSKKTVQPQNYPFNKSKEEWAKIINDLYKQWGMRWSQAVG